ncbi:hypothetical protein K431DRAFT_107907 [Polychaeton citri CBS 116435]|uniref:Uncharacterized protein n=1 Tax=Polychaeton citri CBS 116435 TaxID=1314669 RepID=A0A9P4Q763_9PEZI|nr:hypothetical protein K431DRAFT_107907 [Polychaeton citri CBS 116435]
MAYGKMILIFLHFILSGLKGSEIHDFVHSAINILKTVTGLCHSAQEALLWPICVIGCFARGVQRESFRDIRESAFDSDYVQKQWSECWEAIDAGRRGDTWERAAKICV